MSGSTQIFNGNVYIINGRVDAPPPAEQTRVFLSYARADDDPDYDDPAKSLLRRLTNDLTDADFAVWWDRVSLPSRSLPFTTEIETAIRDCDRFVLIAAPHAATSDWVRAELKCALDLCKPITVILRAGDYSVIPSDLSDVNAIDFRPPRAYAAALADVIARLRQPAPLGDLFGVKQLPRYLIERQQPFADARAAICADAITPTVISAPPRGVALFGVGGVGKTTLASALAHDCDVRRTFPDGVIWLEIGQTPTIQTRQADIGRVFGDPVSEYVGEGKDAQSAALRLHALLRDKTALIVLDDVWDHKVVAYFPIEASRCRLLITTRSSKLARQIDGADIRLDLLTPEEGAALIAKRVGGDADDPVYRQIAVTLGGHTLAVSLAAAQIENHYADNAADLLRLLTKRENPFAHLKLADDDKNENLELSLSLSYRALMPEVQRRFRALGAFALESTFDRAALAALWGDADPDDGRAPLVTLIDAGLLEAADGRYRQHRLLRAYARALLTDAGEVETCANRHFDHYAALHGDFDANNDEDRHPIITPDFDNITLALDWGFEAKPGQACDFVWALNYYMQFYLPLGAQHVLLEGGQKAAEAAGYVGGLANTLCALGDLSASEDELGAAREDYGRALPLYEQIADRLGLANTLRAFGDLSVRQAELDGARGYYDRALPLYEQIGDRLGLANTLRAFGDLSVRQAELDGARGYYDRALPLYEQIGARLGLANTLRALGDLSVRQDELDGARGYYDRALPLYEQIGDRLGLANTLRAFGDLSVRQAELDGARGYYDRALPLYEQIGDRLGLANTLRAFGDLSVRQAELDGARGYYDRALPLYEQIGDRLGLANTLRAFGDLSVRQAELDGARGYYDRALPLYEQIGARLGLANTLRALGDLSVRQDELDGARGYYDRAQHLYSLIQSTMGKLNVLISYARLAQRTGDILKAKELFEQLFAITDALPAFRNHPITQNLRREYQQLLAGDAPVQNTLPKQTVETLANNTMAVKTGVPDQLDEWRGRLVELQAEWAGQGADYASETAFAAALLAVLDDQPAALPDDNPYQDAVRQVVAAIQAFKGA